MRLLQGLRSSPCKKDQCVNFFQAHPFLSGVANCNANMDDAVRKMEFIFPSLINWRRLEFSPFFELYGHENDMWKSIKKYDPKGRGVCEIE